MSLYREAGRRRTGRLVAIAAAVLLVGLLAGFAIGRATAPDPTSADVVAELRGELQPIANGLEILPTEYPQGGAESAGVKSGLDRMDAAYRAAAGDLRVLDPQGAARLREALSAVREAVESGADASEVSRLGRQASAALEGVPGGR